MRTLLLCLLIAGCGAPTGAPLVSATYPPSQSGNSQPQPLNSLPPGAANDDGGPNAVQPNYLSWTFGL